ncbi:MAG: hypothetical protein HC876_10840 [Chloroflexaceae bacterium]|nr:hypothetical protein [Chloroflexaceae bacterium]
MSASAPANAAPTWRLLHSRSAVLVLALALLLGAVLRLLFNNQPFPTSDHAETAAIATFFYPRSLDALIPSGRSVWQIFTAVHGILPPFIGMAVTTLAGLLGIPITEFVWNLPFVLIHLSSLPLAALLISRLGSGRGGMIAAFFLAVLPIHIALSRASGVTHTPLNTLCQMITIVLLVRYVAQPTPRHARHAGLALSINLLTDQLFPLLFVLVFGTIFLALHRDEEHQRVRHSGGGCGAHAPLPPIPTCCLARCWWCRCIW